MAARACLRGPSTLKKALRHAFRQLHAQNHRSKSQLKIAVRSHWSELQVSVHTKLCSTLLCSPLLYAWICTGSHYIQALGSGSQPLVSATLLHAFIATVRSKIAAQACLGGHCALEMAAPACLRDHCTLRIAAHACLRSHCALKVAAHARLRGHGALKMAARACLRVTARS